MTLDPRPVRTTAAGTELDVTQLIDRYGPLPHSLVEAVNDAAAFGKTTTLTCSGRVIALITPPADVKGR